MNDDPRTPELDEQQALAVSGVLDGTATADELALVEASPALQAWIERYRSTVADLQDVTVSALDRDRSILAALAVFDAIDEVGGADVPVASPAAPVVSLVDRARRRWTPRAALGAAAAVVAVLAIGGAILDSNGADRDDDAAAPLPATAAADGTAAKVDVGDGDQSTFAEDAAPSEVEMSSVSTIDGIMAPADPITAADDAADVGSTDAPGDAEPAPADSVAPAATQPAAEEETPAAGGTDASGTEITAVVADPGALADFVARVDAERVASTTTGAVPAATAPTTSPATSPSPSCFSADLDVVGYVLYGADEVPAVVVRGLRATGDDVRGEVSAVALATCEVLVVIMM